MSDDIVPTWRDRLSRELKTFDNEERPLLSSQLNAFKSCVALTKERPLETLQNSRKHRYGRLRAKTFLFDVLHHICPEVFVLCSLALPISDLSRLRPKEALPNLREWWKSVDHPKGLEATSNRLCKDLPKVSNEIRNESVEIHGGDETAGPSEQTADLNAENLSPSRDLEEFDVPSTTQVESEPSQYETNRSTSAVIPHQSSLVINLKDLFTFLAQYEKDWPDLAVVCPWSGMPLPFTEINTEKVNGKLQFSLETMAALIKFRDRTTCVHDENI